MQIRPRLTREEFKLIEDYRLRNKGLAEECDLVGIDAADVKQFWYKGKHYSINGRGAGGVNYTKVIEDIVKEYIPHKPLKINQTKSVCPRAIKGTVTDMHVGLEPNPNNRGLFQYEYNADIFKENLNKVF